MGLYRRKENELEILQEEILDELKLGNSRFVNGCTNTRRIGKEETEKLLLDLSKEQNSWRAKNWILKDEK